MSALLGYPGAASARLPVLEAAQAPPSTGMVRFPPDDTHRAAFGGEEEGGSLEEASLVPQGQTCSESVLFPFLPKPSRCRERSLWQDLGLSHLLIAAQGLLPPPASISPS